MASFIFLPVIFYNTCIRKRFSDKQNYTDHDNLDNDQIITLKRGNSPNSFDFNDVYSFCRIIDLFCMSDGFVCFFDALPEKYAFKLTIKRKRSCTSQLSLNPCLFSTPYAWHKV